MNLRPGVKAICFDHTHRLYGALAIDSPYAIRILDVTWPTVSHYLLGEQFPEAVRVGLRLTRTVEEAMQLIASGDFIMRNKWDVAHDEFLYRALVAKFTQHLDLEDLLRSTGDSLLIYFDELDAYLGTGPDGKGHNMLGRLLMRVRRKLPHLSLLYSRGAAIAQRVEAYETAVEMDPSDEDSLSGLADAYYEAGWFELAITAARRSLAISDDWEASNFETIVLSLKALGREEETVDYLKKLIRLKPKTSRFLRLLSNALANSGREVAAKVYARRAQLIDQKRKQEGKEDPGDEQYC